MADTTAQDIHEIQQLLWRYATACDGKDWDLLTSCFTDDAVLDYSTTQGPVGSREEVCGWLQASLTQIPWTMHYVTNFDITIDGDTASVRSMFYNPMHIPGMEEMTFTGGYYRNTVVRTPDGWKISWMYEDNMWFVNRPTRPGS